MTATELAKGMMLHDLASALIAIAIIVTVVILSIAVFLIDESIRLRRIRRNTKKVHK